MSKDLQGTEVRGGSGAQFITGGDTRVQAAATMGGPRGALQVTGGPTSQGVILPGVGAHTPQMGGMFQKIVEDATQKNQADAFYQGMVTARSGLSIEEIKKDQPWYANLFGLNDSFLRGASWYTEQKVMVDWEQDVLNGMHEFRQMSSADAGKQFNELANSRFTGDAATDTAIKQAMIERAQPILDLHTKSRYAWLQQQAVQKQTDLIGQASSVFNQTLTQYGELTGDPAKDQEGRLMATQAMLNTLVPVAGQSEESIQKMYTSVATLAARRGEFHTVNLMREAGYFDMLPPEKKRQLEDTLDRYENRAVMRLKAGRFGIEQAVWAAQAATGNSSIMEVSEEAERINREVQNITGISSPFIEYTDIIGHGKSAGVALIRAEEARLEKLATEAKAAKTAADKEAVEARQTSQIIDMWTAGRGGYAANMPGVSQGSIDFATAPIEEFNPEVFRQQAINNFNVGGYVNQQVASKWQALTNASIGEAWNEDFNTSYTKWSELYRSTGGEATAAAYYGDDLNLKMMAYDALIQGGTNQDFAHRQVFGAESRFGKGVVDPDERKDAAEAIAKEISSVDAFWFSENQLLPSSENVIMQSMAGHYALLKRNNPALSTGNAAKQAYNWAKQNGLEHYGAYAWVNPKGVQPLHAELGIDPDYVTTILNEAIGRKAQQAGVKTSFFKENVTDDTDVVILRLPAQGDQPSQLYVNLVEEGTNNYVIINTDDLKAIRNEEAMTGRFNPRPSVNFRSRAPMPFSDTWEGTLERRTGIMSPKSIFSND